MYSAHLGPRWRIYISIHARVHIILRRRDGGDVAGRDGGGSTDEGVRSLYITCIFYTRDGQGEGDTVVYIIRGDEKAR